MEFQGSIANISLQAESKNATLCEVHNTSTSQVYLGY